MRDRGSALGSTTILRDGSSEGSFPILHGRPRLET
jgi:hypothetical protein